MIPKGDILRAILQESLKAGSGDIEELVSVIDAIENQKYIMGGEEEFLGEEFGSIQAAVDFIEETERPMEFNDFMYAVLDYVVARLNVFYDVQLEDGEHYEIYINYLDSHLYPLEEGINNLDLSKKEKKEIINILGEFA